MSYPRPPDASIASRWLPTGSVREIWIVWSIPNARARVELELGRAATVTDAAPPDLISWASSRPVGPAPNTRAETRARP